MENEPAEGKRPQTLGARTGNRVGLTLVGTSEPRSVGTQTLAKRLQGMRVRATQSGWQGGAPALEQAPERQIWVHPWAAFGAPGAPRALFMLLSDGKPVPVPGWTELLQGYEPIPAVVSCEVGL